jgi:hypothetical protein
MDEIKTQVDKVLVCLGAPVEVRSISRKIANRVWNDGQATINLPNGRKYRLSYNSMAMSVQCQEVI